MKQVFGIFSPIYELAKNIPKILLLKTLMPDSKNCLLKDGKIVRRKMREKIPSWVSPTNFNDPDSKWTNEGNAYDDDASTYAGSAFIASKSWGKYIELTISAITCDRVRISANYSTSFISKVSADVYYGADWHNIYEGIFNDLEWTILRMDTSRSITKMRLRFYNNRTTSYPAFLYEAHFGKEARIPDNNPILHYHTFTKRSTGSQYLLAFTKAHIYCWDWTEKEWVVKFTCSADCESWVVVTYNDEVVATNYVDKVLHSDMSGNFTPLDTASGIEYSTGVYLTKAKYLIAFENFLILGYTTEDGEVYPQRIRWSDLGQAGTGNWKTGDAGSLEIGKADFLIGFGKYQGYLIIFKEDSCYKMWLVPTSAVFETEPLSDSIGCKANGSIVNDKFGRLFFLASDFTIREIKGGEISFPIDPTVKTITPAYAHLIKSAFIDEYSQIVWAIPYNSTTNNKLLVLKNSKWEQIDLPISAFGNFKRQTGYTWDTLPYSTWDNWGWEKWNLQEADIGFEIELGADFFGYTYALFANEKDDEADYTGYFVLSTDLQEKRGLSFYKRILDLELYVRKETTGTLTVEIKRDHEANWQSAGEITLTGTQDILVKHLPVDFKAKHFLIKISGGNRFRFIGIMFRSIPAGER
ncbi:hypothetical protein KAX08_05705 [candidate division WOR-3 bacterium]|nr:hypothetical protein [candidate division WOR-3 bacterium]